MEERNDLSRFFFEHTGKYSDRWSSYLDIYWTLFEPIMQTELDLLEIGIQNGGSLEIWAKLFPNAKNLIGLDSDRKCSELRFSDSRIKLWVGDGADVTARDYVRKISSDLGIVIDDGSHVSRDIIRSFLIFFPLVKPGGIYVIEDLHASYWADWQGGISHPESSMQFLKLLADVVNFDHWGISDTRSDLLKFIPATEGLLEEEVLSDIESVSFLNSVCVIRKKTSANQGLGTRIGGGSEASVSSRATEAAGKTVQVPSQASNQFANVQDISLAKAQTYRSENQELSKQNQELSKEVSYATESIRDLKFSLSWRVTKPLRNVWSFFLRL